MTNYEPKKLMREQGLSFKEAVNSSLRRGLAPTRRVDVVVPAFDLGVPRVDTLHALQMSADLEDEEISREISTGR